jgi:UDP-glucose 4-epimerase
MKYLVIGGGGFIGSYVVDKLLCDESISKVIVYDNFCSGKKWHLKEHIDNKKFKLVEKDIFDDEIFEYSKDIDVTIMLAANADISAAMTDPQIDFNQGTYLLQIVLEAMRKGGCNKLLYASGSGVYGEIGYEFVKEDFSPMEPISTYGASKLGCEALICSYCHMFEINASAFRFGNVVGGRQTHGVTYDFMRRLKRDSSFLEILGDGMQSKPYIHVEDVISAMFIALQNQKKIYNVYNVAPKEPATVNEIADIVLEQMKIDKSDCEYKYTGGNRGWKGDVPIVRLDTQKISDLGWKSSMNSVEAVRKSAKEMHENLDNIIKDD